MRLLVLLESSADVRIPPHRGPRSGRVRVGWQVSRLDPAAAHALDAALALRADQPGTEVVAVLLGPAEDDVFLRDALARGCDEVVRVWDDECRGLHAPGKALILAAACRAARCDLVLAGAAGAATSSAQVGVLVAAHLDMPCVTRAVELEMQPGGAVRVTRALAGGFREIVEVSPPALFTFVTAESDVTPAPVAAVLHAHARAVPVWDLAEIGVPREDVRRADGSVRYGRASTPRPATRAARAPDPAAPAFERIGELVRGTVRRRDGRVSSRPAEESAEELFRLLRDRGWLDHLREREDE
ncbi:MAG: electron transfer flavoprotein subunit beta/FixA family protein [Thermoleophilia bacterium]